MPELRYEVIISWSDEAEAFIAEVPELPGCAADGASYQEALLNVQHIMEDWIETAKELGRPIPEPRGGLGRLPGSLRHLAGERAVSVEEMGEAVRRRAGKKHATELHEP